MTNKEKFYTEESFYNKGNLNLREIIEKYLFLWKWFLLGVVVSVFFAWVYLRYTTPKYSATGTIMIKDNQKSGISTELEAFKDLGIIGGSSSNNPDNEIEILKSRKIIGKVVDTLNLNIKYYVEGRVISSEVYRNQNPIEFQFIKKDSSIISKDTLITFKTKNEKNFELIPEDSESSMTYSYDELIQTKLGTFKIVKNPNYRKEDFSYPINILLKPKSKTIDQYRNFINISLINRNSSVLTLNLVDPVRKKAEDILNEIVQQYNLDAIKDKNQVSEKTKDFIDDRLKNVGKELALIDDSVRKFKSDKNFTGLPDEARLILESFSNNNQKIVELKTQLSLANWIERQLQLESAKNDVLPGSLGFEDSTISQYIGEYNTLIIERSRRKDNAGKLNPVLLQLNKQIETLKGNLLKSLSNVRKSIDLQLKEFQKEEAKISLQVTSIPIKERGFIDIARQQEIIGGLYSYLLKKKEETDISLAVTVPNAKIIDYAYSSNLPVSPRRKIIYLAALILGMLVPFTIIYIRDLLDTKIHSKSDLESELSIPYLGDIPTTDSTEKIIIEDNVRSSTAEAFRLIRTNIDFMLANNNNSKSKTIFITSTTSGEGKSFVSINLAATLALSNKKVVLVGMDLRAPKITEYLGIPERHGITNYLTNPSLSVEDIKFNIPQLNDLDILASGLIPPNPAELLMTSKIEEFFDTLKSQYDFIIVDTAPVNLVTDTLLISKYADMFIYTIRANYLDKRMLGVPKALYSEKRLPNMALLLNDTDAKKGYGYGYGGYGYGYTVSKKPWYKRVFDRK